jgi:hypothetical protein
MRDYSKKTITYGCKQLWPGICNFYNIKRENRVEKPSSLDITGKVGYNISC